MVIKLQENISKLLKNFAEYYENIEVVFLYTREGLMIAKYAKEGFKLEEQAENTSEILHGAITSLVEDLFKKISSDYNIDQFQAA